MTVANSPTMALAVLEKGGLTLPPAAEAQLVVSGFSSPEKRAGAIAVAVLSGMDPTQLAMPKNMMVLAQAWRNVEEYGAMPGYHFYLTPFDKREYKDGEWIVTGVEYAIVDSINWLQSNVDAKGHTDGVTYILDPKPVFGKQLDELLELYAPDGFVKGPRNRGALARFIPVHARSGQRLNDPEYQFGYALYDGWTVEKKDKKGNVTGTYVTGSDMKGSARQPNNSLQAVAMRRATRMAARVVTRAKYAVNSKSVEARIAVLSQRAYEKFIDMDLSSLQGRLPEEASDIIVDSPEDIQGYMADDAREEPAIEVRSQPQVKAAPPPAKTEPAPAPVTQEDGEEEAPSWNDLSMYVRRETSLEARALADQLYMLRDGKISMGNTMVNLRSFIAQAAQGDEVIGEENSTNVRFSDFVLYATFGIQFGRDIYAKQAAYFFPLIARQEGAGKNARWVYDDDSEGAKFVREIRDCVAGELAGVAETF